MKHFTLIHIAMVSSEWFFLGSFIHFICSLVHQSSRCHTKNPNHASLPKSKAILYIRISAQVMIHSPCSLSSMFSILLNSFLFIPMLLVLPHLSTSLVAQILCILTFLFFWEQTLYICLCSRDLEPDGLGSNLESTTY